MDWTPVFAAAAGAGIPALVSFMREALLQWQKKQGRKQSRADAAKQRAALVEQYAYTLYSHYLQLASQCGEDVSQIPPPPVPQDFDKTKPSPDGGGFLYPKNKKEEDGNG